MLRRGVVAGLCLIVALAAWLAWLVALRGVMREGGIASVARVLDFDGALPPLAGKPVGEPRARDVTNTRLVTLQILSGPEAGSVRLSCATEPPNPRKKIPWRRGLLVRAEVSARPTGRAETAVTRPPLRFGRTVALGAILAVVLLALAPATGAKTLACVGLLLVLGRAFLSGLLAGLPPLPATVGFSMVVVSGTVFVISGPGRKSLAALSGAGGAVLATGLIAAIASRALGITGLDSTGARFLLDMTRDRGFTLDFQGLALSGTLIVVLGSSCDLAVGVASAVAGLCDSSPETDRRRAFEYGLTVGRDTGTTMTVTLVFAFVGLRLPAFLFGKVVGLSPVEVVNSEAGTIEIARALIACVGFLLTIPITALASAVLLAGRKNERRAVFASLRAALRHPTCRMLYWLLAAETGLAAVLLAAGLVLGAPCRRPLPWRGKEDSPEAHLRSARAYLGSGRPDLAVPRLWRARELDPSDPQLHAWFGHACYLLGWPEQAAEELGKAARLGPGDPRALQYLGRVHTAAGSYDRAVSALEACSAVSPDDPDVLCDLATACAGLGEWDRAKSLAEQALRLAPGHTRARAILDGIAFPGIGR